MHTTFFFAGWLTFINGLWRARTKALRLFHRAVELDPDFASAYGMAAYCYFWRKVNGWTVNYEQEKGEAGRLARRAVDLGKDDAVALTFGGNTLAHAVGDVEGAAAFIDRALTLNPNLAAAWHYSGQTKI